MNQVVIKIEIKYAKWKCAKRRISHRNDFDVVVVNAAFPLVNLRDVFKPWCCWIDGAWLMHNLMWRDRSSSDEEAYACMCNLQRFFIDGCYVRWKASFSALVGSSQSNDARIRSRNKKSIVNIIINYTYAYSMC